MKKCSRIFVIALCCLILFLSAGCSKPVSQLHDLSQPQIVGKVGKSALLRAGDPETGVQYVLLLQGTHYEIGYAYGKLLAGPVKATVEGTLQLAKMSDGSLRHVSIERLEKAYQQACAGIPEARGIELGRIVSALGRLNRDGYIKIEQRPIDTLETIYKATDKYIPVKYKEEIKGLSDGVGLDLHKVELANLFPEMFHCSTFSLANKATQDGGLIHGRILDYAAGTDSKLQSSAVVIVMRPEGENAIMMASYMGFLGCITGLNDKQISVGMMGMGDYGKWEGFPMSYLLRSVLDETGTLEEALKKFKQAKRTCQYAYVISDGKTKKTAGVHATPKAAQVFRMGKKTKLWPEAIPDCVVVSGGSRYPELVKRIRQRYGHIDPTATVEIMKRPVASGSNLHSAVMLPSTGVMYVANASVKPSEQPQACYRPYYKYDLKVFLAMMDQLAKK